MKASRFLNVLLALALLAGALAFSPVKPARAATVTVNTLTDESDFDCGGDGDCSLRDALLFASSGDTITFSVTGTILLTLGELAVNNNLTITGPDANNPSAITLDGNNASRVIHIAAGQTVAISNLTIQNGKVIDEHGAGIKAEVNGSLTLDNVIISGNSAVRSSNSFLFGGGVYAGGVASSLTITNSEIDGNDAERLGGGVYFGGGVLNMQKVKVINNTGTAAGGNSLGGGIYVDFASTANFDSVLISGNQALTNGGLFINNVTNTTITNSLIASNTATYGGGGLYLNGQSNQTVNITNVTISGNHADDAFGSGGGIFMDGVDTSFIVNLNHVTITLNTTGSFGGGGVRIGTGTFKLKNSILAGNSATGSTDADCSGAIASQDYNIVQDTDGCTFSGLTTHNITGVSAQLDALSDNGGFTETHEPATLSPALEAIPDGTNGCGTLFTSDQRGGGRPADSNDDLTPACEIGAFERFEVAATNITADTPDPSLVGQSVNVSVTVSAVGNTPTGTVSITGADTNCNITLSGGSGSCNVVFNSAGPKTLTANYGGDLGHAGGAMDTEGHTVAVNQAPVITSNGGGSAANKSVAENTTAVTTVTATDANAGTTLTFSIIGGADSARFGINSSSGVLTFLAAPNFEAPTDAGANNVYNVNVQVSDGSLTDSQSIAVTVTNANEAPTNISLSNSIVAENLPVGTTVGALSTIDPDAGNTHTYSFCGGANDASFSIAGASLKTAAIFDFETKSSYAICIRANDGNGGTLNKNFTINISNQPDTITVTFKSTAANDGWTLESGENTNVGGTMNGNATTLRIGDDAARKQYRSILSFNTGPTLPDNAVITKVTLKVRQQGIVGGGNPVSAFQGFMVDMRKGTFGTSALQVNDWKATANKTFGPFSPTLTGGFYAMNLTSAKAQINKLATGSGLTQIRLRFQLDDDDNAAANFLSIFSGNAGAASQPQLIVEYHVP